MQVLGVNATDLSRACEYIMRGELVAFPTETVYGLGANVFDEKAVAKVFEAKKRPYFDPLICHVAEKSFVSKIAHIPHQELFDNLTKAFWPGPLTFVLPKKTVVSDLITGGLGTVAVRMPDNEIARALIEGSSGAIAAPSANPFGYISPTTAAHVIGAFGDEVAAVIDGGPATLGIESTVIDLSSEVVQVLRYGSLAIEDIEEVLGCNLSYYSNVNKLKIKSPGQIKKHYAPRKPLLRFSNSKDLEGVDLSRAGLLMFEYDAIEKRAAVTKVLSETGDLVEAAANLFRFLHELENADIDIIYAGAVPQCGLGLAIEDRLARASNN